MSATAEVALKTHWTTLVQRVRATDMVTAEALEDWLRTLERVVKSSDAIVQIGDRDMIVPASVKDEIQRLRMALRDLCDAIPDATVAADPPLGEWVAQGRATLPPTVNT